MGQMRNTTKEVVLGEKAEWKNVVSWIVVEIMTLLRTAISKGQKSVETVASTDMYW
jgi:hypothetical protein